MSRHLADTSHALIETLLAEDSDPSCPILIAGPTASGKSGLAMALAAKSGRPIVNADALQVFDGWRILTARPSLEEEALTPHALYGHIAPDQDYSVGQWLRDLDPFLTQPKAPIIVGGTGLYFTALTEGLADIPATDPVIRAEATALFKKNGLESLLAGLDAVTLSRLDLNNPMRVQRAWEVQRQTGRGLAAWQETTQTPRLPLSSVTALVLDADRDWLSDRISRRFEVMLDAGVLDEAHAMRPGWDPDHPSSKAIGAAELIAHLRGEMGLCDTKDAVLVQTRQYAKRQRTWFRNRMSLWSRLDAEDVAERIKK
ncbi:MAG: tRNA (adenosine(37)-N6)-dimethylallyltransferase MiaA [Pseudomonadota bacterium]